MDTKVKVIPRIRRVIYATYANFPTTGLKTGDLAYATDRLVFYRWSGAAWQSLTIHSSSGTAANIPAAADVPNGSLYYETDTAKTKQVQAGAWVEISAKRQIVTGSYAGNGADGRQITTGFKCTLVIVKAMAGSHQTCIMIPSETLRLDSAPTIDGVVANDYLHATDGFVVEQTNTGMNDATPLTYYYWAIAE